MILYITANMATPTLMYYTRRTRWKIHNQRHHNTGGTTYKYLTTKDDRSETDNRAGLDALEKIKIPSLAGFECVTLTCYI